MTSSKELRRRHTIDPGMTDEEIAAAVAATAGKARVAGVLTELEKLTPRKQRLEISKVKCKNPHQPWERCGNCTV